MMFMDDEEKDKEEGSVSDDALEEILDEDEDEDAEIAEEGLAEEKDWA